MEYQGNNKSMKKWSLEQKFEYNLKLQKELHQFYEIVTKLVLYCLKRNLKLIIENPYSTQHYLIRYWPLKPVLIDFDRTKMGDISIKPTAYWFINCKPKNNITLEKIKRSYDFTTINEAGGRKGCRRSLITKQYAESFIKRYIL